MTIMDKVDRIVRPLYRSCASTIILFGATGIACSMGYISEQTASYIIAIGSGFTAAYFIEEEFDFIK